MYKVVAASRMETATVRLFFIAMDRS